MQLMSKCEDVMCHSECVILSVSVCTCLCFGDSKIAPQKADAKRGGYKTTQIAVEF